jgi:hypothetical protein
MKMSVIATVAALVVSTSAYAQAPAAGNAPNNAGETEMKGKSDSPSMGSGADSAAKDGQWSGSCEQQNKSGAPTATDGTTDGSGMNPNNC